MHYKLVKLPVLFLFVSMVVRSDEYLWIKDIKDVKGVGVNVAPKRSFLGTVYAEERTHVESDEELKRKVDQAIQELTVKFDKELERKVDRIKEELTIKFIEEIQKEYDRQCPSGESLTCSEYKKKIEALIAGLKASIKAVS